MVLTGSMSNLYRQLIIQLDQIGYRQQIESAGGNDTYGLGVMRVPIFSVTQGKKHV